MEQSSIYAESGFKVKESTLVAELFKRNVPTGPVFSDVSA